MKTIRILFSLFLALGVCLTFITPVQADSLNITEYNIPTPNGGPVGIAKGPDGNLWFTEYLSGKIGKITTNGVVTEYDTTLNSNPISITAGADGNLWFTEQGSNKIGKITTSGIVTEYNIPTFDSSPAGIAKGPDGNLWFTEYLSGKIGKITTNGVITEYNIPESVLSPSSPSRPYSITAGSDGNLWFTESGNNQIGKITPSGIITQYDIPLDSRYGSYTNSAPYGIATGSNGSMWFTAGNVVGEITTGGIITRHNFDSPSRPYIITAGPDGNLWFTIQNNQIGKITTGGVITYYDIPTPNSLPHGITAGSDGNLWFTEYESNKIAKFNPSNITMDSCTPLWQTGAWSSCSNGQQTRTVTDSNNCGVTTGKPVTTQSCTLAPNITITDITVDKNIYVTYVNNGSKTAGRFLIQLSTPTKSFSTVAFYVPAFSVSIKTIGYALTNLGLTPGATATITATIVWQGTTPAGATGSTLSKTITIPTIPCTSFAYSAWSVCDTGTRSRTVVTSYPKSCIGGTPVLTQNCLDPIPTIANILPTSVVVGSPAFTITVNGKFTPSSVIGYFGFAGPSNLATTYVSAKKLTATVPASAITAATKISFYVANPPPGGGPSNVKPFIIKPLALATTTTTATPPPSSSLTTSNPSQGIWGSLFASLSSVIHNLLRWK